MNTGQPANQEIFQPDNQQTKRSFNQTALSQKSNTLQVTFSLPFSLEGSSSFQHPQITQDRIKLIKILLLYYFPLKSTNSKEQTLG